MRTDYGIGRDELYKLQNLLHRCVVNIMAEEERASSF